MIYVSVSAQEKPPRPITVTVIVSQNLSFGYFAQGTLGGTVSVSSSGTRSRTGDIVLLTGGSVSPALFDVVGNPGTLITIVNGSDVSLNGSNGGTLMLHIGASSTGSPFITTAAYPTPNHVYVGGTLTVGNQVANPPGDYGGTFQVTFIQQ
ncbi:MAG: DUF4402 domain-containing protein [Bacteroidota bacterium]